MFDMIWATITMIVKDHPELLIFLSLAIGYAAGKISIGGFSLGSTASVLLAALVLGQFGVIITPLIKSISFALFIFTIGYKVGPDFFGGLKKEGLQYVILSLFFAIIGLVTAVVLAKLFGFNQGTAAGLMAGALTQSSIIGTAQGALNGLSLPASELHLFESDIAIAYAITYIFGVAGLILFYKIVPHLMGLDMKKEAQALEEPHEEAVEKSGQKPLVENNVTDIAMLALGCFLGTLIGIAALKIGVVSLTLGTGGGILLAGLLFGWLHKKWPSVGAIPPAAQWVLSDLGLNLFIACVGLTAGPRAVDALEKQGLALFFAGVVLTLVPHILGLLFGKFILRINPVLLLGALTGAGTATPSLNVLKNECDSAVPALGYTIPYAIGNIILTIWGALIVAIL